MNLAAKYGFQRDTFEKVLRLKKVLECFQQDSLLNKHLVLKGGTAINLTIFPLPRVSVDIDMDYIPNDSREDMLSTREKISETIKNIMEDEGYQLAAESDHHCRQKTNYQRKLRQMVCGTDSISEAGRLHPASGSQGPAL